MTAPVKPMKTERTHEENQERAYIAASRRSDRSLEARVESARRASEIHKKRTGRALRVREEDVINEEMYEEEDYRTNHYRALTAHLQTTNVNFDRRLQASLTSQMAMRSAFSLAMSNGGQFSQQQQQQFGNEFINPAMMQPPSSGLQNPMSPQNFSPEPSSYRQSPYPTSNVSPSTGQMMGGSPASMATLPEDRRMSLPAQNMVQPTPHAAQHGQSPNQPSSTLSRSASSSRLSTSQHQRHASHPTSANGGSMYDQDIDSSISPLTMALPIETQQILYGSPFFDMNDPIFGGMMSLHQPGMVPNQNEMKPPHSFYPYNPRNQRQASSRRNQQDAKGLNQTLLSDTLSTSTRESGDEFKDPSAPANTDLLKSSLSSNSFNFSYNPYFTARDSTDGMPNSAFSSGQVTPIGDEEWKNFLDGDAFGESQSTT